MGTLAVVGTLAQGIPDAIDADNLELAIVLALVACAILAVLVLRTVTKALTRGLLLAILLAAGIGLWVERDKLEDCRGQCSCRVFAQDVDMGNVPGIDCP